MTHRAINRDFFIKFTGLPGYAWGTSTLRSSKKTMEIIGADLYERLIDRVYSAGLDSFKYKLRGGVDTPQLVIDFYTK